MDRAKYFAGLVKPGSPKFKRCVRLYGPLPEKEVEKAVEEVTEPIEEVVEKKKPRKKAKKTTKSKTEE